MSRTDGPHFFVRPAVVDKASSGPGDELLSLVRIEIIVELGASRGGSGRPTLGTVVLHHPHCALLPWDRPKLGGTTAETGVSRLVRDRSVSVESSGQFGTAERTVRIPDVLDHVRRRGVPGANLVASDQDGGGVPLAMLRTGTFRQDVDADATADLVGPLSVRRMSPPGRLSGDIRGAAGIGLAVMRGGSDARILENGLGGDRAWGPALAAGADSQKSRQSRQQQSAE